MKRIILITVYAFILYILPFIATNSLFNFINETEITLILFHVSGIVLCILIERNKDHLLEWLLPTNTKYMHYSLFIMRLNLARFHYLLVEYFLAWY